MSDVIAIFVADIHLSHTPPTARSVEPDWYEAMARPLRELRELAKWYQCPVICAGDIFDRWNSLPELINFAIKELPKMYAVPGQHDLPHHNYDDIKRSAYWTLVEAGVIENLSGVEIICDGVFCLGFPWGAELRSPERDYDRDGKNIWVAVCHHFAWSNRQQAYPGAPESGNVSNLRKKLRGFDVAVFGDNHLGFVTDQAGCKILNCGCLICRNQNERKYASGPLLLFDDMTVGRHVLDASEDKWLDIEESQLVEDARNVEGLEEFLSMLNKLGTHCLDFRGAMEQYIEEHSVDDNTKRILLEAMEGK